MAVIQPTVTRLNKDTCALISWAALTLRSGTASAAGGTPILSWLTGLHGLLAKDIGTVHYLTPTTGTAGLYQLTAVGSTTTATFSLVSGNSTLVTAVVTTLGDIGGAYSQADAVLDRTLQVHGVFGAAGSISMYGTNDALNFAVLKDNAGANLAVTTTTVRNVFDGPLYFQPMVTVGDATTTLNAIILLRIQLPRAFQ